MNAKAGYLIGINEFVVRARLQEDLDISEQVWVGEKRLTAEVMRMETGGATIQVYEDTTGLKVGAPVFRSGRPLSVTLGPGMIGKVYDGIQRPLDILKKRSGIYLRRGAEAEALDPEHRWHFAPVVETGAQLNAGDVLGTIQETPLIEHRLMVPPGPGGELTALVQEGEYTIRDRIAVFKDKQGRQHELGLSQQWEVRRPRPVARRLQPGIPLITGQRVIDTFFPLAKGGKAAIPGGFGTGKTILQHALAQWSDADVILYIGCGERGNEMTEVLETFPRLQDPVSGHPLMERTILIANTSNMPVSARESSIYTGVTMAEYYRDQGHDVALMADSTSRWAQALREISGRLGEMPVEEGYPAYLSSRLSAFYERAGRVRTLGGKEASVSLIGAVSPPGGDFSEPVTRHTQRFTQCWLALDRDLAHQRHYPAISWLASYSLQADAVSKWWHEEVDANWRSLRHTAVEILRQESDLQQLVQLVGSDALSDRQQWLLTGARLLREGFLQQNALNEIDAYAVPKKQTALLRLILDVYQKGEQLLDSVALPRIRQALNVPELIRLRSRISNDDYKQLDQRRQDLISKLNKLASQEKQEA